MSENLSQELFTENYDEADIIMKGIPFDNACSVGKGAAEAPELLRSLSNVLPPINETGAIMKNIKIMDKGDFEPDLNWERFFNTVETETRKMIKSGKFCMFLGGDHSVSIPLIKAFCDANEGKKIGVIHFDSHLDITIEYEGHRWSHACTQRRTMENDNMHKRGLTLVGIRSFLEEELDYLSQNQGIRVMTAYEVYKKGIDKIINELIDRYQDFDAIYITVDIDVLDPAFAPGTGTPEGGGLSTREMMELMRELVSKLPVKAADVVEVSPPLDTENNITSWAALKIIWEIFAALNKKKI